MIKVIDLKKIYTPKKGVPVTALNGVNLDFSDKGMVFLLGKSGSGKSTLLNLIGGLDTYTDGDIVIKGKSTKDFKQSNFDSYRNTLVGFIFQEFNILEEYSVGRNIGLALELQNKPSDKIAVEEMLAQVDLDGYFDRKPNELSGGQKQRIAIARALIKNPDIIMADEPTGALDSNTGTQVFDTLKKLSLEKLVIVVSHDRENAEVYGDRIIELADGNIISDRIKNTNTSGFVEQPVAVVDEKLLRIKAGKKLTDEEISLIVDTIEKSEEDAYFSFDSKANKAFIKKSTMINAGSTTFEDTSPEKIETKEYNAEDLILTKSRLPIKDSFKMGATGLTHKRFRLSISIILSFITFVMVGFCISASFFDGIKVELQTAYDTKLPYVTIEKKKVDRMGSIYNTNMIDGFSAAEIAKYEQLSGKKSIPLYQNQYGMGMGLNENMTNYPKNDDPRDVYYSTYIKNIAIITSESDLNLEPIGKSKLPLEYNEIAITDYIADSYIKYGYSYGRGETKDEYEITSAEELIGKKITHEFLGIEYIITGVYKTPMDKEQFAKYKDQKSDIFSQMVFDGSCTIMGLGFASPKFELIDRNTDVESVPNGSIARLQKNISVDYLGSSVLNKYEILFNYKNDDVKYKEGFDEKLKENEVIVSRLLLETIIGNKFTPETYFSLPKEDRTISIVYNGRSIQESEIVGIYPDTRESNIAFSYEFASKLYKSDKNVDGVNISGGFSSTLWQIDSEEIHPQFVTRVKNLDKYNSNSDKSSIYWGKTNGVENKPRVLADNEIIISPYHLIDTSRGGVEINRADIESKFDKLSSKEVVLCLNVQFDSLERPIMRNEDVSKTFKIVGVGFDLQLEFIASDSYYNELVEIANRPTKILIAAPKVENRAKFETMLRAKSKKDVNGNCETDIIGTQISRLISNAMDLTQVLVTVFKYAIIALSLFATILMMNFITTSISYKKKDIGVLRAIGARSSDIFKIFFAESSIIALIITTLSFIGISVISALVNKSFMISVLVFNPWTYIAMAALCLAISFIATFISTYRIAKMKPIDAIHNK